MRSGIEVVCQTRNMTPPLPDRYADVQLIGQGAFGDVYRARDSTLARLVAIKVARERSDHSAEMDGFVTEARHAAGLDHPNIVTVYDLIFQDDHLLMVMEYAAGGTLHDQIDRGGRLQPAEVARRIREVAAGLEHAHEQGFVHRDVKPSNLLIGAGDVTKVADFGLAREIDRSTTNMAGTHGYMAPEQFHDGRKPTPAADVFALAVTAYELLTGNSHGGFSRIVGDEPPLLVSEVLEGVDPAVDEVLARALQLKPTNRTSTVTGFANDLSRALTGARRRPGSGLWSSPLPEQRGGEQSAADDAPWFIGVTWSAASGDRDAAKNVWVALVRHGKLVGLEPELSLDQAGDFIDVGRQQDDPVLVGMDFGFSLPAWWVDAHYGGSAPRLWEGMQHLEWDSEPDPQWPKQLPPPFWGPNIRRRPALPPGGRWLRETEERVWRRTGVEPKSVFQLSGAGRVGGQSVRGMTELYALQSVGWRIWPFDAPGRQAIVEVLPRALWRAHATRQGASSPSEARAALAPILCGFLQVEDLDLCDLITWEHSAFEAAFIAWALSKTAPALPDLTDHAMAQREGWIWRPDQLLF